MARGFRRRGSGPGARYVAVLDADERAVVASLMEQVRSMLEPPDAPDHGDDEFADIVAGIGLDDAGDAGGSGSSTDDLPSGEPRDPALDRLLPPGHRDDPTAAAEFRRLTEHGLRHRKAAGLEAAAAALRADDRVRLDEASARAFVTALTDVRLVLGERLELRTDEDLDLVEELARSLDPEDPLVHVLALYDFLTWLQETLASALLGG
jgi:hypothetical protein